MKIRIAFLLPPKSMGGGYRKYIEYYSHLDTKFVEKFIISLQANSLPDGQWYDSQSKSEIHSMSEQTFLQYVIEKKIDFVYCGASISDSFRDSLSAHCHLLYNINFLPSHKPHAKANYFAISKTLYHKMTCAKSTILPQTSVVYNPIPTSRWISLAHKDKASIESVITIGRLARAEPSKWDPLIISTLMTLDKRNDTRCRFIFVGMPLLYRMALRVLLSGRMLSHITFERLKGSPKDIADFYNRIDVFWQASVDGETFGNAMVEAYCFGKPVIADCKHFVSSSGIVLQHSDNSQLEIVDEGVTGRILYEPKIIADYLQTVTHKELRQLGENGRKKAKLYDAAVSCESLCKHLYLILRKNGAAKIEAFEHLHVSPTELELSTFAKEYTERLANAKRINRRGSVSQAMGWRMIEFLYLGIRKVLRLVSVDLERNS